MSARYTFLFEKYSKKLEKFYNETLLDLDGNPISKEDQTKTLFDKLWNLDPTQKKSRADAILQWYINSPIQDEDLYKITENLEFFESHKSHFPEKNLMAYKTYEDFFDAVYPILETLQNNQNESLSENQKEKLYKKEMLKQTEILEETDTYLLLSPKTAEASCYWGRGTQWCTAATKSENMFDSYTENGKLYVILEKKTAVNPTPKKYQFHLSSYQFMDVRDKPISQDMIKTIQELYKDYPDSLLKAYCTYFALEKPQDFQFQDINKKGLHKIIQEIPHVYKHLPIEEITQNHVLEALKDKKHFFDTYRRIHHLVNDDIIKSLSHVLFIGNTEEIEKNINFYLKTFSEETYDDPVLKLYATYFPKEFQKNYPKIYEIFLKHNPSFILEIPNNSSKDHQKPKNGINHNDPFFIGNNDKDCYDSIKNTEDLRVFRYYRPESYLSRYLNHKDLLECLMENKSFPIDTQDNTFEDDVIRILRAKKISIYGMPNGIEKLYSVFASEKLSEKERIQIHQNFLNRVLDKLKQTPVAENKVVVENLYHLVQNFQNKLAKFEKTNPQEDYGKKGLTPNKIFTSIKKIFEPEHSVAKDTTTIRKFLDIAKLYAKKGYFPDFGNFAYDPHIKDLIETSNSSTLKKLFEDHQKREEEGTKKVPSLQYISQKELPYHFQKTLSLYSKESLYSEETKRLFRNLYKNKDIKKILLNSYSLLKENPEAYHYFTPLLFDITEEDFSSTPCSFSNFKDFKKTLSKDIKLLYQENPRFYAESLRKSIPALLHKDDEKFPDKFVIALQKSFNQLTDKQKRTLEALIWENIETHIKIDSLSPKILTEIFKSSFVKNSCSLFLKIKLLESYSEKNNLKGYKKESVDAIEEILKENTNILQKLPKHTSQTFFRILDNFFNQSFAKIKERLEDQTDILSFIIDPQKTSPQDVFERLSFYFKHYNEKKHENYNPQTIPENKLKSVFVKFYKLQEILTDDQKRKLETICLSPIFSENLDSPETLKKYYQDRFSDVTDYESLAYITEGFIKNSTLKESFSEKPNAKPVNLNTPDLQTLLNGISWESSEKKIPVREIYGNKLCSDFFLLIKFLEKQDPPTLQNYLKETQGNNFLKSLRILPDFLRKKDSTLELFKDFLIEKEKIQDFYKIVHDVYSDLPENKKTKILQELYQKKLDHIKSGNSIFGIMDQEKCLKVIPEYFSEIRQKIKEDLIREIRTKNIRYQSSFLFFSEVPEDIKQDNELQRKTLRTHKNNTPTWILPISENTLKSESDAELLESYKKNPKLTILDPTKTLSPKDALQIYATEIERVLLNTYSSEILKETTLSKINGIPIQDKTDQDLLDLHKKLKDLLSQHNQKDFKQNALLFLKNHPLSVELKTVQTKTHTGTLYTIPQYIFQQIYPHSEETGQSLLRQGNLEDQKLEEVLKKYQNTSNKVLLTDKLDPVSKVLLKNLPKEKTPYSQKKPKTPCL